MQIKLKILVGILVFLILVNLATIGSFFYFQAKKPDFKDGKSRYFSELPMEKKQLIKDSFFQFKESSKELIDAIRQNERKLYELLIADEVDTTAIYNTLNEINRLNEQKAKKGIERLLLLKKELTPEEQRIVFRIILREKGQFRKSAGGKDRKGRPSFPDAFIR